MRTLGLMIFVGLAPLWLGVVSAVFGLTYEVIRWLLFGPRKPKPIDLAQFYHEPGQPFPGAPSRERGPRIETLVIPHR